MAKPSETTKPPTAPPSSFVTVKPSSSSWTRSIPHLFKSSNIWMYGSLAIILFVGSILGKSILTRQSLETKATVGQAKIQLLPAKQTMPPDSLFQLWLTADMPVASVDVAIHFNPEHIRLAQNPNFTNAAITSTIHSTTIEEANNTGIITLSLTTNQPKTGTFLLSTLTFTPITTIPNTDTVISIDSQTLHLTQTTNAQFSVTSQDATVTLNPSGEYNR